MADYIGLPQVTQTSAADTTGQNTGNYSTVFAAGAALPLISQYEIYHMTVQDAPVLASAQILIRNSLFSTVLADLSGSNEWDPSQPAIVNYGDEIDFLWNVASTVALAPVVVLWLRYDASLARNQQQPVG